MNEAFSKTFDCEASPEFGVKFAVLQEQLNTILSEIHSKLAEDGAVLVTVSRADCEVDTYRHTEEPIEIKHKSIEQPSQVRYTLTISKQF